MAPIKVSNNIMNGQSWREYAKKRKKQSYTKKYGLAWAELSKKLRWFYKRCQWCGKSSRPRDLAGHHIGCFEYNPEYLLDVRTILVVCRPCHLMLEPYSKIVLEQHFPQMFE